MLKKFYSNPEYLGIMKKTLSIVATMSVIYPTVASADLMRVEGAIGAWESSPSGTITYAGKNTFDVEDTAGLVSSTNIYAWINIKHPAPLLPNFRFEYADPRFDGDISKPEWNRNTYNSVENTLSLTQYDVTLFYNLLDNTFWTTLDLGLDIKIIDGNYKLDESIGLALTPAVDAELSLVMPLGYIRTRVEIPVTNIGIEAIARGMSYGGNTILDAQIKLDYTLDFVPIIQPGLEIGYRYQQIKLDKGSIELDADIDATFSGVYGGVMFRF